MNAKKDWSNISISMSKKFPEVRFTSKKCQARWKSSVNPELKKHTNNQQNTLKRFRGITINSLPL
jgi:hypothetical protein